MANPGSPTSLSTNQVMTRGVHRPGWHHVCRGLTGVFGSPLWSQLRLAPGYLHSFSVCWKDPGKSRYSLRKIHFPMRHRNTSALLSMTTISPMQRQKGIPAAGGAETIRESIYLRFPCGREVNDSLKFTFQPTEFEIDLST